MRILPGQCRQGTAPGDQDVISDQRCSPARLGPADGNIGRQTPWASATSRGPAVAPWRRELMSLSLPRGSMRCSLKCCTRQAERQSLPRTSMIESFASVTPNRRSFVPTSVTEHFRPSPAVRWRRAFSAVDRRPSFRRHLYARQMGRSRFPLDFVPGGAGNSRGVFLRNGVDTGEPLRTCTWNGITLVAVDHTIARRRRARDRVGPYSQSKHDDNDQDRCQKSHHQV